jgi:hypothetical protein
LCREKCKMFNVHKMRFFNVFQPNQPNLA